MTKSYNTGRHTKQQILQTSTHLFYEQGIQETTFDHICEKADINRAMIAYYFKNKDSLSIAVYEEVWLGISRILWQILTSLEPEIRHYAYFFFSHHLLIDSHYARFLMELHCHHFHNQKIIEEKKLFWKSITDKHCEINQKDLSILFQMDCGIEKEIIQMMYHQPDIAYCNHIVSMELFMILGYIGYKKEEIQSLIDRTLKSICHYELKIENDFKLLVEKI